MAAGVLLTRPDGDNDTLGAQLTAAGAEVHTVSLLVEVPVAASLPDAADYAGVLVTSRRGAAALGRMGLTEGWLSLPVHAVGEATAAAVRALGFADVDVADGTGADMARRIIAAPPRGRLFYAGARDRSPDLEAGLSAGGIAVDTRVVYAMDPAPALPGAVAAALAAGRIGAASFLSRRTAGVFVALVGAERFDSLRRGLVCLCLSEACAEPLRRAGFAQIRIAAGPDAAAMAALALAFVGTR